MATNDFEKNNKDVQEEFDIIDFDLNEYDEEFQKEEEKLQLRKAKKEEDGSRAQVIKKKLESKSISDEPNRDMLKTILLILVVIVIACLFLGFISLMVNSVGGDKPKIKKKTTVTTEFTDTQYKETPSDNKHDSEDEEKKEFEDSIEEITNNVIEDTTTQATTQEPTTQEPTTEATTKPTTEATTETTTEATTQPPTEPLPEEENPTPEDDDISVDATPIQ